MKIKLIIRTAGISPADHPNPCSCGRENAADSSHPPSHVGGHHRISATVFLVAASCLCLLPSAVAEPGSWTQKADMPAPTSTPASCVVDGILYVMGGHYPYQTALKTVWAYNPQTDLWTPKADMPTERRFAAAAAVDGIVYVVGGSGVGWFGAPVLPVAAYDPKTDMWVTKANIPTGRLTLAACAVDGIIYAIGGTTSYPNGLRTVEAYDPKTNLWSKKRDLPTGLLFLTASVLDGVIYVFAGNQTSTQTLAYAYDPKTDQWTAKGRFSPWSFGLMSATVDGIIYLFGGMTQDLYGSYDFTLAYDPAQDRFSARRKMRRTWVTAGCGVIDGKVYLAAGVNKEPVVNTGVVYYKTVDVFDPQGGVTPQILSLTCESTNRVRLAWQGEAGFRYGVQSTLNIANGPWTSTRFPGGVYSVLATNAVVEATCTVPTADTNRFFRVLELEQ
jgi:N-acetylneuraminic acid mutarotase